MGWLLFKSSVLAFATPGQSLAHLLCRLLNFDDRSDADDVAQQRKGDAIRQDNLDKQGMPGPNMSLAYRDDEVERQNFANEPTLE